MIIGFSTLTLPALLQSSVHFFGRLLPHPSTILFTLVWTTVKLFPAVVLPHSTLVWTIVELLPIFSPATVSLGPPPLSASLSSVEMSVCFITLCLSIFAHFVVSSIHFQCSLCLLDSSSGTSLCSTLVCPLEMPPLTLNNESVADGSTF